MSAEDPCVCVGGQEPLRFLQGFGVERGFRAFHQILKRVLYLPDVKFEGVRSRFPFLLSDTIVNLIQSHLCPLSSASGPGRMGNHLKYVLNLNLKTS